VGAAFLPSSRRAVSVFETQLAVGPQLRVPLGGRVELTAAARLGTLIHASDRGSTEWDVLTEVPLELAWRAFDRTRFGLLVLGATTYRSRRYVREGVDVWESGPLRLAGALTVRHEIGP
jgi:hypothetical protein